MKIRTLLSIGLSIGLSSALVGMVIIAGAVAKTADASIVPSFSLSQSNNSSGQIHIYGDANSNIELHYGSGANQVATIGATDSSGYALIPISASGYNVQCGNTAYVIVDGSQSPTISWSFPGVQCASLSLSQTNVTLVPGQTSTVIANADSNIFLSSNSNSSAVGVSVSGNQITLTAQNFGTANITFCSSDGSNSCATVSVAVQTSSSSNSNSSSISFSQTNVSLNIGQSIPISVYGSGIYSISTNSNPTNISASISGTTLNLYGVGFGSGVITICQNSGGCGTVYASVTNTTISAANNNGVGPALSSFSVASNTINNQFAGVGSTITLNFSVNENVTTPYVTIGNSRLTATGSGSGPYSVTYTIHGSEGTPIPVTLSMTDSFGRSAQQAFSLGAGAVAQPVVNYPTTPPAVTTPTAVGDGYVFSNFLAAGVTSNDVTELQKRLTAIGFYSGPITGYFGPLTEAAVTAFQKAHSIAAVGYVGPSTRAALNQ